MKAISYQGPRKMSVSTHSKPKIKKPTDALLRVTTTGICGSDLHMYDGRTPLDKGTVVGHEIMGVIEEVGEARSRGGQFRTSASTRPARRSGPTLGQVV